jgi:hypothetical protein
MRRMRRYDRLNIYLDDSTLRERIKVAAARHGTTVSAYCVAAIRRRLGADGFPSDLGDRRGAAAEALDTLRREIGPVGVPVTELIAEGRK